MDPIASEEPIPYPPVVSNQSSKGTVLGQWTTGLYDCFDDPSICFLTCCCPCITFGQIAEIIDEGKTCWQSNVERSNQDGSTVPPIFASSMDR
ncbi:hypothetical protein FRX31_031381 [Thalictrum thalictroides]|uniref:Uncharacterized protein n=1 Tax=Thalictrum thalictroides TaxID=46969 RepID=A0A7J6V2X2_THATH|nr:hypothetical protein FRX31_031381 [Thalictrum thalictroides]